MIQIRLSMLLLLSLVLAGCLTLREEHATIRGLIVHREQVQLPEDAVLEVRLLDVQGDGNRTVFSKRIQVRGQLPVTYTMECPISKIPPGRKGSVQATIRSGGKIWMVTRNVNLVMDGNRVSRADIIIDWPPAEGVP